MCIRDRLGWFASTSCLVAVSAPFWQTTNIKGDRSGVAFGAAVVFDMVFVRSGSFWAAQANTATDAQQAKTSANRVNRFLKLGIGNPKR